MVEYFSFLRKLDFYTSTPLFFYNSKFSVESKIGGSLTILLFIILIILFYFFGAEIFFRYNEFHFMENYNSDLEREVNLDKLGLNFGIIDGLTGLPVNYDDSIFSVSFNFWDYKRNNFNLDIVHERKLEHLEGGFFSPKLDFNLTTKNYFSIEVTICHKGSNCKNLIEIQNFIKNKGFYLSYNNNYISSNSVQNLMSIREEKFGKLMSIAAHQKYSLYFDNYDFLDDTKNLFASEHKEEMIEKTYRATEMVSNSYPNDYSDSDHIILEIMFILSGRSILITKRCKKLFSVIAEVSGMFNIVTFLFRFLFSLNGRFALESYVYNKLKSKRGNSEIRTRMMSARTIKENNFESKPHSPRKSDSDSDDESYEKNEVNNKKESQNISNSSVHVSQLRPSVIKSLENLKMLKNEAKCKSEKRETPNSQKGSPLMYPVINSPISPQLLSINKGGFKVSSRPELSSLNLNSSQNLQTNPDMVRLNPPENEDCLRSLNVNIGSSEKREIPKNLQTVKIMQSFENQLSELEENPKNPMKKLTSPILKYSIIESRKNLNKLGLNFGNVNQINNGKRSTDFGGMENDERIRVEKKHDKVVEQTNTVLSFLSKHIPKQAAQSSLPLKDKVLALYKSFMDPANIMTLNIKVILLIHLLLDDDKKSLVEEFCNDEKIIGVIYDFITMFKPKLNNMRTFIDPKIRDFKMQIETKDNLIFAILNCIKDVNK